jgi:hypothetical protein
MWCVVRGLQLGDTADRGHSDSGLLITPFEGQSHTELGWQPVCGKVRADSRPIVMTKLARKLHGSDQLSGARACLDASHVTARVNKKREAMRQFGHVTVVSIMASGGARGACQTVRRGGGAVTVEWLRPCGGQE